MVGRQIVLVWPTWRPRIYDSRLQHSYRSRSSRFNRWGKHSFRRKSPKNVKVLRCHVGHTTILHRPLPSAVLSRKLAIIKFGVLGWTISDIDFISITPNLIMASWRHRNVVRFYYLFSLAYVFLLVPKFEILPKFEVVYLFTDIVSIHYCF